MKGKKNSCDRENKGVHHVIEMIAFQFTDRVCHAVLDSDAATSDDVSTTQGIDCSSKKIDVLAEDRVISKECMYRLTTDSSGGGTREGISEEMNKPNHFCHTPNFFVATCVLRAMNRLMQSLWETFLGNGRIGQRNQIQLLHAS